MLAPVTNQVPEPVSLLTKVAVVVVFLLTGPTMYLVSRVHTLTLAFSRVQVGDTRAMVMVTMGRPQREVPAANGEADYEYSAWPLSRTWVVGLRDGKVVTKAQVLN
jgi:hypothetical protein